MRNIRKFIFVFYVTLIFGINVLAVQATTADFDLSPLLGNKKAEAINKINLAQGTVLCVAI